MSDASDPYSKLRPHGETPAEELCSCQGVPAIVLMRRFGENPVVCLECNGEMPPERVGFPGDVAEEIAHWRTFYAAFDTLWLDSREFEEFALRELTDPKSAVNVRGLEATRLLNETRRAYMYWFQDTAAPDLVSLTACPRCGAALTPLAGKLVCEACRIAVYN